MTHTRRAEHVQSSGKPRSNDRAVMVAMAIVVAAIGAALHAHLGWPLWRAAMSAVTIYILLTAAHVIFGRSAPSSAEDAFSGEGFEEDSPEASGTAKAGAPVVSAAAADPVLPSAPALRPPPPPAPRDAKGQIPPPAETWALPSPAEQGASLHRRTAARAPERMASPRLSGQLQPAEGPAVAPTATMRAPSLPVEQPDGAAELADAMRDYWSFRPAAEAHSTLSGAGPVPPRPQPDQVRSPPAGANVHAVASPREADVEMIQGLIKKLADEVNAAELLERAAGPAVGPGTTAAPGMPSNPAVRSGPLAPRQHDSAIQSSLDALRTAAGAMRAAAPPSSRPAERRGAMAQDCVPPPIPAMPPSAHPRVSALAAAISAGRIDVFLEPILGLDDQTARHYEVSIRVQGPLGAMLEAEGGLTELKGTGLLSLFDRARIVRTTAVAQRLDERGKTGAVFSAFSGESLASRDFVADVAHGAGLHGALARQLVLSFTQSDVRGFEAPEWEALAFIRAQGFRFALSGVTDVAMDFERLASSGFGFVKLDADVFLDGLPSPDGVIPANDICRHFSGLGLTLIVEQIDDEAKLARIFGFGALFGQGQLFGGARPVKADALGRPSHAAA